MTEYRSGAGEGRKAFLKDAEALMRTSLRQSWWTVRGLMRCVLVPFAEKFDMKPPSEDWVRRRLQRWEIQQMVVAVWRQLGSRRVTYYRMGPGA